MREENRPGSARMNKIRGSDTLANRFMIITFSHMLTETNKPELWTNQKIALHVK